MKMKRWFAVLLIICFSSSGLFAAEEGKVVETVLENGLKVLTVEMHTAPIVYSQIAYKVGSRNEKLGITGISHLTEHMMFKGTPTYPKGVISGLIKKNGGIFNAFTGRDMTAYYEQLPANKLELALSIESDRMQNCMIDAAEYQLEREVVKEERRMRTEDSPSGILMEELYSVAFKSHSYHNPVVGWMSDINSITRDQVYQYYKTYYTPNNATLVLVGDFETDKVLQLVRKYFGRIPKGPEVPAMNLVEETQVTRREIVLKRVDQKSLVLNIAFHIPAMGHPDLAPLYVAANVLGSGSTSRLYKLLVEEKKYVNTVRAIMPRSKDPDLFRISISFLLGKEDKLEEVQGLIFQEIRRLQDEPISDYELQKVRNRLKYNEVFRNQKVSSVGSRLATYETFVGWRYVDQWYRQIAEVSKEDVQRVMQLYFDPDRCTIALLKPDKSGSGQIAKKARKTKKTKTSDLENTGEITASNQFVSDFDYKDLAKEIIRPKKIAHRIQKAKLSNGVQVYLIEDHLFPVFHLQGLIETGNVPEESEKPGLCALFGRMMNRGTRNKSYEELSRIKSFFPVSFSFNAGNGRISFSGSGLMENVDTLLALGREMLNEPAFKEADLESQRERMITVLQRAEGGTGWKTSRFLFQSVYKNHPYGRFHTPQTLRSVTVADLFSFHKKYIRPENMVLVVQGDFTKNQVLKKLETAFGDLKNPTSFQKRPFPKVQKTEGKIVKVFPMPEKKQADVRLGFNWVRKGDPEEDVLDLLNHILGGSSLTSRLGVVIRDKQGLAYGISSKIRNREKGGIWFVSTKTEGKNVQKLIASTFSEIERIKQKGVTEQELKDAKAYFLSILPMVIETPDDVQGIVYDMVRNHKPLNDFDTYFDRILKIKVKDVNRAAKKYLSTKNYVLTVAGPVDEHVLDKYK